MSFWYETSMLCSFLYPSLTKIPSERYVQSTSNAHQFILWAYFDLYPSPTYVAYSHSHNNIRLWIVLRKWGWWSFKLVVIAISRRLESSTVPHLVQANNKWNINTSQYWPFVYRIYHFVHRGSIMPKAIHTYLSYLHYNIVYWSFWLKRT